MEHTSPETVTDPKAASTASAEGLHPRVDVLFSRVSTTPVLAVEVEVEVVLVLEEPDDDFSSSSFDCARAVNPKKKTSPNIRSRFFQFVVVRNRDKSFV